MAPSSLCNSSMDSSVSPFNDPSRSLVALDQDSTLIAVTEMGQPRWLVGGLVSGLARAADEPDARCAGAVRGAASLARGSGEGGTADRADLRGL